MPTSVSLPYDWLKELEPELAKLDDSPLIGHPPVFPWNQFTQQLASLFELDDLKITPSEIQWRAAQDLYSDLPSPLLPIDISISGFKGLVHWILPEIDIPMLMATLLEHRDGVPLHHINKEYQEGFYRFLGIEVVNAFTQVDFDPNLVPHLNTGTTLPQGHSLCMDITISFRHHSFTGRLIISETFREEWKRRYTTTSLMSNPHTKKLAGNVIITATLEAGRTPLSLKQWKKAKVGDFVLIEKCSLTEDFKNGKVLINYRGTPVYIAELEEGNIKILQALQYHEAVTTIERKLMNDDDDLEEEDSTEENSDFDEDELEDEETEDEENDDDDFEFHHDDDEVETEEEEEAEEENDTEEYTEQEEQEEAEAEEEVSVAPKSVSPEGPINAEDLPISLIIEVGRINISVQKLLEMQAGNILELSVRPEDGVSLVINGRCVGKGELHRLGKTLGVRILELG